MVLPCDRLPALSVWNRQHEVTWRIDGGVKMGFGTIASTESGRRFSRSVAKHVASVITTSLSVLVADDTHANLASSGCNGAAFQSTGDAINARKRSTSYMAAWAAGDNWGRMRSKAWSVLGSSTYTEGMPAA